MRGFILAAGAGILFAGALLVELRSAGAASSTPPPRCCVRIFVMNADGTRQSVLTAGVGNEDTDVEPAWSPNGRKIAYSGVFVMNADGRGAVRLGHGAEPAWSPDGRRIAFTYGDDIFVMTARGTGATSLTHGEGDNFAPAWSPDGSKIVFSSNRNGNLDLFVVNADGSGETTRLTVDTTHEDYPAWSPDGGTIAYARRGESTEIYVMRPDGSGQAPLPNRAYGFEPAWSPGGQRIAFSALDGVRVMRANGSRQVLRAGGRDPAWSPDGKTIVFSRLSFSGCVVPDVVGRSLPVARETVRRVGCAVGRIRRVSSTRPLRRVLRQRPDPGAELAQGGHVHLVVSRGRR